MQEWAGPKKAIIFTIPRGLTADIVRSTAKQGDRGVACKSNKKRPEPRYRTFFYARRITEPKQEVEDVDRPPSKGRKVGRGGGTLGLNLWGSIDGGGGKGGDVRNRLSQLVGFILSSFRGAY